MDRVTASLLNSFSQQYSIESLSEDKRFEHFSAFSMIRRHYSRSFSTTDIVIGGGGDTGADTIAIIVNNVLTTDVDTLRELAEQNGYLDVTFVFIQSSRTSGFSAAKIGTLGFSVTDFFAASPSLPRSEEVNRLAEITEVLITEYAAILRQLKCHLYYVTTGNLQDDANLQARVDNVLSDIRSLSIFGSCTMSLVGAPELHTAYRRTQSPVTKMIKFEKRVELPATEGVIQSSIGYLPFSEFKKLLEDDSGSEMLTSIFEDNVRDWQGYQLVNSGIRKTLLSENKSKFVMMNNGITIIARGLTSVGSSFTVSDYQIVNGCQSSNVLFENRDKIDDSVSVPVRLIHTEDESLRELITTATNSQAEIKPEQFASSRNFARIIEAFFTTYPDEFRLYYERRDGQYDRSAVVKVRVVDTPTVLRSYASIYQEIPHVATKNYKAVREDIGSKVFVEGHKPVAYYYAAYSWFLLEGFYRNKVITATYKSARFHILLAVHLLIDASAKPQGNSQAIEKRSEACLAVLHDPTRANEVFRKAIELIDDITLNNLARDNVRTEATTNAIIMRLRSKEATGAAGHG